jgi:hypothetical protein
VNTQTIAAGTLQLVYGNPLQVNPDSTLSAALDDASTQIALASAVSLVEGSAFQVGSELMVVVQAPLNSTITVVRGGLASTAVTHSVGDHVWILTPKTYILPFAEGFFGNSESSSYSHVLPLPDVRIVAAQLYMTNDRGDGQTQTTCFSQLPSNGIHTFSGGQMSMQVAGILGIQQNATPPLLVDASHEIRGVQAFLGTAASGGPIQLALLQDTTQLCTVTIPDGATSGTADAQPSSPLIAGSLLSLNVLTVPAGTGTSPGRDLTLAILL